MSEEYQPSSVNITIITPTSSMSVLEQMAILFDRCLAEGLVFKGSKIHAHMRRIIELIEKENDGRQEEAGRLHEVRGKEGQEGSESGEEDREAD